MPNFGIDKMHIKYFVQILHICASSLWFLESFCWFFSNCPAAINSTEMKFSDFSNISNQNMASPSPPAVPPLTYLKSMDSQLSLEKNYPSSSFEIRRWNRSKNDDSGEQTRETSLATCNKKHTKSNDSRHHIYKICENSLTFEKMHWDWKIYLRSFDEVRAVLYRLGARHS